MIRSYLKQTIIQTADMIGIDRFFRYINRKKLLVVMYHGVTRNNYDPPVWTQLPLKSFRSQMEFLRSHYLPIALQDVTAAIRGERALPERAVLVTFDDGLSNNYSCAFPVLQRLGIPAAIFLTVGLIGSQKVLWFDELLFLLQKAMTQGINPELDNPEAELLFQKGQLWQTYQLTVEGLKRAGATERARVMERLRAEIPLDHKELLEDFGMLTWPEIRSMQRSGLIEFGVHTATHRILTELADDEWYHEIIAPRTTLEKELQKEVTAFCFPNGRPGSDFSAAHLTALRNSGYSCSFTTENALFDCSVGDHMTISRVPAGNDGTSDPAYFALNASGALHLAKEWLGRGNGSTATTLTGAHP